MALRRPTLSIPPASQRPGARPSLAMQASPGLQASIQPLEARKASAKRRLSPADPMSSESGHRPKRKVTNPLLILVQSQVEGELGVLEEQYNSLVSSRGGLSRQDSDPTPTYDQVPADILGSQESLLSLCDGQDSMPSGPLTSFSSSYTSWTRPMVGQRVSDSCAPASSILDCAPSPMPPPPPPCSFQLSRSRRRSRPSRRSGKRDSSADTSKDIDDIEDFDLDADDSDSGSYEVEDGLGGEAVSEGWSEPP